MTNRDILFLVVGVAVGALGSYYYLNGKYEVIMQEEMEDMRKRYSRDTIPDPDTEPKVEIVRPKLVNKYHTLANNYVSPAELVQHKDYRKVEEPYVISDESFHEEMKEYDKITLYYYTVDDVVADEADEIVEDIVNVIGPRSLDALFKLFSIGDEDNEDPDVIHVRNERLEIDYEIIRMEKSYSETIGEPLDSLEE